MGSDKEEVCLKWVNSLKMVQSSDAEHLDLNRYEKQKIFSRVTGKSMYKDYELLLETYESKVHIEIESQLNEFLSKKSKNKVVEPEPLPLNKKLTNKKPVIKKKETNGESEKKLEEENFIKNLP